MNLKLLDNLKDLRLEKSKDLNSNTVKILLELIRFKFKIGGIDLDTWARNDENYNELCKFLVEFLGENAASMITWAEPICVSETTDFGVLHGVGGFWEHRFLSVITTDYSNYSTPNGGEKEAIESTQKLKKYDELNLSIFNKDYIVKNLEKTMEDVEDLEHYIYFSPNSTIEFITTDGKNTTMLRFLKASRIFLGVRSSKLFHSWYPKVLKELGLIEEIDQLPDYYFDDYESILITLEYIKSMDCFNNSALLLLPVSSDFKFISYGHITRELKKHKPEGRKLSVIKMLIERVKEQGIEL